MRNIDEKITFILDGFRVLDLSDDKGYLCGKILADLGADVIKVERPGGDPSRNIGPFYKDIPDPEKSLSWFAYNTNKRSITLNIEVKDGQSIFRRLAKKADLIIESFAPGYLEELGLGFGTLSKEIPELIMTSISPFGQKGPYKNFRAPDIVVMAMGGVMYVWGDPDRPPVRLSVDQAYLHASADAAVGSIIALYHKEISGEGQHIDVSAQESVTLAILESVPYYDMNGFIRTRTGPVWASISKEDIITKHTWDCRDGYITFEVLGGKAGASFNRALMSWIASEGLRDEMLENINWEEFDYSKATQDVHDRVGFFLGKFFRKHTVKELYQGAVERRIIIYPVTNAKDISEDEQLRARNFWEYIYHPELENTVPYVGSFAKFSNGNFGIKKRAPLIGEHNEEIYKQEYGFTSEDLLIFKQNRVI